MPITHPFTPVARASRSPRALGAALTLACGAANAQGIDQAIDSFFASAFGWAESNTKCNTDLLN